MKFTARTWKFGDNINTDLILPNVAFYLTPQEQLPKLLRGPAQAWQSYDRTAFDPSDKEQRECLESQ